MELKRGRDVVYRSSGNSLYPWVVSNDACHFTPVNSDEEVAESDIVFAEVQPKNRFFAHNVKAKFQYEGKWCYTIANASGYENGWCYIDTIYGKLKANWYKLCSQISSAEHSIQDGGSASST